MSVWSGLLEAVVIALSLLLLLACVWAMLAARRLVSASRTGEQLPAWLSPGTAFAPMVVVGIALFVCAVAAALL
jgi:hypothetical protein